MQLEVGGQGWDRNVLLFRKHGGICRNEMVRQALRPRRMRTEGLDEQALGSFGKAVGLKGASVRCACALSCYGAVGGVRRCWGTVAMLETGGAGTQKPDGLGF
jgi:hypothetical protein